MNVEFHGRILYACDSTPVAGVQVYIKRHYILKDHQESETLATATSNSDGYYSVEIDFIEKGTFMGYSIVETDQTLHTTIRSDLVESEKNPDAINGWFYKNLPMIFHLKNATPFDNNDSFDRILMHPGGFTDDVYDTIFDAGLSQDFIGVNVDSTFIVDQLAISANFYHQALYFLKYFYTKNGIQQIMYDTIPASCPDTSRIEVHY